MRVTPSQRLLRIVLILLFGIGIGALYDPVGGLLRASLVEIKNFAAGHPLEPDTPPPHPHTYTSPRNIYRFRNVDDSL